MFFRKISDNLHMSLNWTIIVSCVDGVDESGGCQAILLVLVATVEWQNWEIPQSFNIGELPHLNDVKRMFLCPLTLKT